MGGAESQMGASEGSELEPSTQTQMDWDAAHSVFHGPCGMWFMRNPVHGCWQTLFWDRLGQVVGDAVHSELFIQNSDLFGSMRQLF
jgi:hypothetical protein